MRSRTMKLLSLALAVCLLLCGCNLIRTDPEYVKQQEAEKAAAEQAAYEADMATVLATYYGDRVVTKGDAVDTYNEQMDMYSSYVTYMNYMASMFGISESQSITAEDAARVRDNVVKEIVKTRVLDQKMLDLGFAAFTEEELAAIQTDATNEYNTYVENAESNGSSHDDAVAILKTSGISEDTVYSAVYGDRVKERLESVVNKDTAVTEEEIKAEYDKLSEEAKTAYTDKPASLESVGNKNQTIYYMPEGYRYIKHVFLKPEDAVMKAYTEAQSAVSALEKEASDLEKQIAEQREATAAEATSSDAAAQTLNDQLTAKQAELAAKQTELEASEQAVWANVQEKLDEVTAGIEAGTPIDELIEKYSDDPGSKQDGIRERGYLVYETSTKWDSAFLRESVALENVGEYSAPFLSSMGVHIVKYESKPEAGVVPFENVKDAAAKAALDEKKETVYNAQVEAWVEEAKPEYSFENWVIK